jgi:hypothetical protein
MMLTDFNDANQNHKTKHLRYRQIQEKLMLNDAWDTVTYIREVQYYRGDGGNQQKVVWIEK